MLIETKRSLKFMAELAGVLETVTKIAGACEKTDLHVASVVDLQQMQNSIRETHAVVTKLYGEFEEVYPLSDCPSDMLSVRSELKNQILFAVNTAGGLVDKLRLIISLKNMM